MSSTLPVTPKKPRNNPKKSPKSAKKTPTNSNTSLGAQLSLMPGKKTSPQPSPATPSKDANTTYESANASEGGSRRKKTRSQKKALDSGNLSPAANGTGKPNHRHTTSQPSIKSPLSIYDSAHYAGPNFHASPAPSALPVPTFNSQSVPESESPLQTLTSDTSSDTSGGDSTPIRPRAVPCLEKEDKCSSSPLDFLFKAARDHERLSSDRTSSGASTPLREQPNPPGMPRDPDTASDTVFPIELDASESRTRTPDSRMMKIGPSFAPSYKDRMNALRSASSPPSPGESYASNDGEKSASNEAWKNLLLNPVQQQRRAGPTSPSTPNSSTLFNPRSNGTTPNNRHMLRQSSGPLTPSSLQKRLPVNGFEHNIAPLRHLTSPVRGEPQNYFSPSPVARREIHNNGFPPYGPQAARGQYPANGHSPKPTFHGNGQYASPTAKMTVSMSPGMQPSQGEITKPESSGVNEVEGDLRRILKLNAKDAPNANGIKQTTA